MGAVSGSEHDPESQEIRRGEEYDDHDTNGTTTPRREEAQHEPEHEQREQGEHETVEEAEEPAGRDPAVDLVADSLRPPARQERSTDEREQRQSEKEPDADADTSRPVRVGPHAFGRRIGHA